MADEPVSGKDGKVFIDGVEVAHIREWSLDRTGNNTVYSSSSTAGHKRRLCGVVDWTATISAFLENGSPFVDADINQIVTLQLISAAGKIREGSAMITDIGEANPVEDASGNTVNFTAGAMEAITLIDS